MGRPERRRQLLNVARDVFVRSGYHATNVDDIVAAACVARGTFYLYFEDKHAIFEEIVDTAIARAGVDADPDQATDRGVSEACSFPMQSAVRRVVRILLADRATTKILLSDALGVDPAFDHKLLCFFDRLTQLLERSLRDGQEHGAVTAGNPRLMARLALGALKEAIFQIVGRGAEFEEAELVSGVLDFLGAGPPEREAVE